MAKLARAKKDSKKEEAKKKASSSKTNKVVDLEREENEEEEEDEEVESDENIEDRPQTEVKSNLLNECKKLFHTTDLYKVLHLEKEKASQNDIKKAYYKQSLRFHPDKVEGNEESKRESTQKFQVLGKVYSILGDEEKRKVYDECGAIDGEDDEGIFSTDIKNWEEYWRNMFKKVSKEDIDSFFKKYKGSKEERQELFAIYEKHKGDMDLILEEFISEDLLEDEARVRQMLEEGVESGEVKRYDKFVRESKGKAKKRRDNYEREAKEAEEMRKELGVDESQESLVKTILAKRKAANDNFLDQLAKKYGAESSGKSGASKKKPNSKKSRKQREIEESDQENEEDEEDFESEEEEEEEEDYKPKKRANSGKGKTAASKNGKLAKKVKRL